jgi:MYXO-CTERM domain-containing protein
VEAFSPCSRYRTVAQERSCHHYALQKCFICRLRRGCPSVYTNVERDLQMCDPATGTCSDPAAPDGTTCDDGNACTSNDACQSGSCTTTVAVDCNDNDECTKDTCDPGEGCVHETGECVAPIPQGGGCDCAVMPGTTSERNPPVWAIAGLFALLGLSRRRR